MSLLASFGVALRALGANKVRAGLTMLGIIIGVGAIIALIAAARGARTAVTNQIQSIGTNLVFVRPGTQLVGGVRGKPGSQPTLTYEDAIAIATAPDMPIELVAPELMTTAQVVAGNANASTRLTGSTPEFEQIRRFYVARGEFINRRHMEYHSLVAVLGDKVATDLFPGRDPVGQTVKISVEGRPGVKFTVVGVIERKGGTGLGSPDDQIIVPLTTMQQRLFAQRNSRGATNVTMINVQVSREDLIDDAVSRIGALLRRRHRVVQDDFTIQSQNDFVKLTDQVTGVMTLLLGSVAGISLLVGGIGIMNIMLVSVTQRTREIGLRKAVGARHRDILAQFLVESLTVSIVGGGFGILLGMGFSRLIAGMQVGTISIDPVITPDAVILAVGVSAAVGVFFGIYPAARAARMNPVRALRWE